LLRRPRGRRFGPPDPRLRRRRGRLTGRLTSCARTFMRWRHRRFAWPEDESSLLEFAKDPQGFVTTQPRHHADLVVTAPAVHPRQNETLLGRELLVGQINGGVEMGPICP